MGSKSNKPDKSPPALGAERNNRADSTGDIFDRGLQHHMADRLEEAETEYRNVLRLQPEHADTLHMLGVIAYQTGQYDEALALIYQAGKLMRPNAGVLQNLGNVLQALGRLDEAVTAFRNAIKFAPDDAITHNNLGNALREQGKMDASFDSLSRALKIDSGYVDAYVNLAITCQAMGNSTLEASSYEQAIARDPGNKPAAHMLAALRGQTTDAAPPEHVERLFDGYAARFDRHLVDTLGYSMPGELRRDIDRNMGKDAHFANAIDLGCGTGLVGVEFNDICGRLVGVDLSARMIDQARERGVYDDLRVGDVVAELEADQGRYDLLICADVFPYIGRVQPLFAAVSSHAREGALFAFSTELETEADFVLRPSGRYAHSKRYLQSVAEEYGFSVLTMRTENLRKQRGEWIPGDLVVLQFRGMGGI